MKKSRLFLAIALGALCLATTQACKNKKQDENAFPVQARIINLQLVHSPELKEYAEQVKNLFASTNQHLSDGTSIGLEFIVLPGVEAAQKIANGEIKADGWLAPSTSLVNYTNTHLENLGAAQRNCEQLFSTPVVLAVGRENVDVFPGQQQKVSWTTLAETKLWRQANTSDASSFVFSHSSPQSATGFAALVQLGFFASLTHGNTLSLELLRSERAAKNLAELEASISNYSLDEATLLERTATAGTKRVRFTITTEQQVAVYNQAHPQDHTPLMALYPEEGSVWQDYSFCTSDADWVNPARRAALNILASFLAAEQTQVLAKKFGFRPTRSNSPEMAPLTPEFGIRTDLPETSYLPVSGDVVSYFLEKWPSLMRSAATLLILDGSGSMQGPTLSLAKEAYRVLLARMDAGGKSGFISFSAQPRLAAPLGTAAPELMLRIDETEAAGGSAIYDSLKLAIDLLTGPEYAGYRKNIVLISDGDDKSSEISLQGILNYVSDKVIRYDMNVFVVGLASGGADLTDLKRIAKVANGFYRDSAPTRIATVFDELFRGTL
ncbi:MAG: VWA domain-containing protein [Oligoflexia bacterium]|nr:VWA domain-containing protein [Oligoflexia bacterium]